MILALLLALFQTPAAPLAPPPAQDGAWPRAEHVDVKVAVDGAVQWLVENQNQDGSWGTHESPRPIEVLASIPGSQEAFRVATTALCVIALRDSEQETPPVKAAIARALDFLLADFDVKRQSGMEHYNVWSFGYALQCFGEEIARDPESSRVPQLRAASAKIVERLGQYQTLDGGWGYLSLDAVPTYQPSFTSMSFTTATMLLGMQRARDVHVELPQKMVDRAVDHVRRSRLPDDSFLYGEYLKYRPRMDINETIGSACRTPACLLVLEGFGEKISKETYAKSLEKLLVLGRDYQKAGVRRPIPHESWYHISGYFYLYGHAYAAYVLEKLDREQQARFWPLLVDAVEYCREPDGSFWDYPLYSYHKPYGTAFALIALSRAQHFGLK
ncbi:MAG: terpene cyclase/mutase family protein [Planctomycetes bacterium]|nr:terpene cyclase/mutase family protein [Planctomycetota bacterium]